jgi:hypothetical protein
MAYDFPNSPTIGQTFTPSGGPTYKWDGVRWTAVPGSPGITITGGVRYDTPQALTASQALQARINIGLGALKNLIRNGAFDIWQRGTSVTYGVAVGVYAYWCDGWMVSSIGGTAPTVSRVANPRAGANTLNAIQIAGAASITNILLAQRIESILAAAMAGKSVTLQAQITNNSGAAITPSLNTYHAGSQDVWTSPVAEVAAASLQPCPNGATTQVSYTFTPAASAINGYMIELSTNAALNTSGKTIIVSEVDLQVTPGLTTGLNSAPPMPEFRLVPEELLICQRYFYKFPSGAFCFPSPSTGGYAFNMTYSFKVTMWSTPTVAGTYSSQSNVSTVNHVTINTDYITDQVVSTGMFNISWTYTASITAEL